MVFRRYFRKLRIHFHDVLKVKTSPHAIALGFAIGTFISILPTPGLNILLGLLVVAIFPKVSKISLFSSFLVWNPFLLILFYPLGYRLGNLILGDVPFVRFDVVLWNEVYNFTLRYFVGTAVIAAAISIACYYLIRWLATRYQEREVPS